jgi:hypothetical protein
MLEQVEWFLSELPLFDHGWGWHILHNLLKQSREFKALLESVMQPLLRPLGYGEFSVVKPTDIFVKTF